MLILIDLGIQATFALFILIQICFITRFIIFYPSTIREWNNLAQEIKDASSVASFKYQLNRETRNRAPPKYYSAGSRKGQILHARLRMQCSSLNADLYRKNTIPSPSCSCCGFESAYHFFYVCPQLTAVRERYLGDALRNHTTHELLCGKPEFTNDENVSLFLKSKILYLSQKDLNNRPTRLYTCKTNVLYLSRPEL